MTEPEMAHDEYEEGMMDYYRRRIGWMAFICLAVALGAFVAFVSIY